MAMFKARYSGTCAACQQRIHIGDTISWTRRGGKRTYHAACAPKADASPAPEPMPAPAPAPAPAPTPAPATTDTLGAAIAAAVEPYLAAKVDAAALDATKTDILAAVDKRLAAFQPDTPRTTITVEYRPRDGAPPRVVEGAHVQFSTLVKLLALRCNVYLHGAPGTGKSHAAAQAAQTMGVPYAYISLNPATPESRLFGYMDAMGTYRETPFYRWYRDGGIFCIDEMDNAHPALLNTLNSMLENGAAAFPGQAMLSRHEDALLVATGNTAGRGGDIAFSERRAFDAAFLDRFASVRWMLDEALEERMVSAVTADKATSTAWLSWARKVRAHTQEQQLSLFVTPRGVAAGARLLAEGFAVADAAEYTIFKGIEDAIRDSILEKHPLPAIGA